MHKEAVEYDLIRLGLRLRQIGTEALTWDDLWCVVTQAPADSAIYRATQGEASVWGITEHLLAKISDGISLLVWMKTTDGTKNRNRPAPIPRPGVVPPKDTNTFKGRPVPVNEIAARLGWSVITGKRGDT